MKKVFAIFLTLLINFMFIVPAFAENENLEETPVFTTQIDDETVFLDPKSTYMLELESDLNINETKENEEIYFRLLSTVRVSNGMTLPEHTRFAGRFKKIKKSSPLFRRARAYIIIDKLIFPDEKIYTVRMEPKTGSDMRAPSSLNTLRAIPASIGVITFSILSVATVAVESASIIGLVVVPKTCSGFGYIISSMAKGLNYKLKAGSQIQFKLDTPVYVKVSDIMK